MAALLSTTPIQGWPEQWPTAKINPGLADTWTNTWGASLRERFQSLAIADEVDWLTGHGAKVSAMEEVAKFIVYSGVGTGSKGGQQRTPMTEKKRRKMPGLGARQIWRALVDAVDKQFCRAR